MRIGKIPSKIGNREPRELMEECKVDDRARDAREEDVKSLLLRPFLKV